MTFTFRPAKRENTPLIVGIAGPTKSGKTYSAHRVARGLVGDGGVVAMINAEGARGHQYADKFTYQTCDISAPYNPQRYIDALKAAADLKPGCIIIDSMSHMHDGPGGLLEYHDQEVDRMLGDDKNNWKRREKMTWAGWIRPKAAENEFIYTMLSVDCPIVLCFRAKEKMKIVPGKEPVDLGWQPIASDRVSFETIFTLMLPPHSKGVPDKDLSEMREPFDKMVRFDEPISEQLGRRLAAWSLGSGESDTPADPSLSRESAGAEDDVLATLREKSLLGVKELRFYWESLGESVQSKYRRNGEFEKCRDAARKADGSRHSEPADH